MSQLDRSTIKRMILREMDEMGIDTAQQGRVFDNNGAEAESGMIRADLFSIGKQAYELHDVIGTYDDLPEWVQSKIVEINTKMQDVHNYLMYEYRRFNTPESQPMDPNMISERKGKSAKAKSSFEKDRHTTSALIKAIETGESYDKLLKLANWSDNPEAVISAAMIVIKGNTLKKKNNGKK